jgi:hypothetical protein
LEVEESFVLVDKIYQQDVSEILMKDIEHFDEYNMVTDETSLN